MEKLVGSSVLMLVLSMGLGCKEQAPPPPSTSPPEPTPRVADPEINKLLDDLEDTLKTYEQAVADYKKEGLAKLGAVGTAQGKMLPLVQAVRDRAKDFAPSQAARFKGLNDRIQKAATELAPNLPDPKTPPKDDAPKKS